MKAKAKPNGHPPNTPLEKGMVALMKKNDLKSLTATKRKGK
jgi:hypothetical protein